jgi:deoxyhypusine synthase
MEPIKDISITKGMSPDSIMRAMHDSGGFTAKKVAESTDILTDMIKDADSLNFLSFPADIISTGARGIIRDMVKNGWFKVLITTCGMLDHDIARCYKPYCHGTFDADDAELLKEGINRLGNIFIPNESYGEILEDKLMEFLKEIYAEGKRDIAVHELCWEIGKRLNNEESILYWAWKNKVPVVVPGITDGSIGYQIWQFWQDHKDFNVNVWKDEQMLSDMVWNAKKSGGLLIGGGISKHHVIWWNQFKKGLDYAVYISTAVEYDGSASGARPREAVSWGKIKPKAKFTMVEADATVVLPMMYASLLERV